MDMEEWNEKYSPGTPVLYTPRDGEPQETETTSGAWHIGAVGPVVRVKCYPQPVWLHRVEPVVEGPARLTLADLRDYFELVEEVPEDADLIGMAIRRMEGLVHIAIGKKELEATKSGGKN